METRKILTILVLALGLMVCQARVSEAAPMGTVFTYQGRLIDANSTADGLYDFQFRLFDDPNVVLGTQLGSDVNQPNVDVIDGYFTAELDFGSSVFSGNAVWLQIGVRPGDMNDPNVYTTLGPRQEITPTPYALQTRGIFVDDTGNVGIGTTTPSYQLHTVDTTPNSDAPAIYGEHAVTDYWGIGVQGIGLYKGIEGSVSATGSSSYYGVYGSATTSSGGGATYGVFGYAGGSAASYGVYGQNDEGTNYGYLGSSSRGVYGSSGYYGIGVFGENYGSGNYGYIGDPNYGVYGKNESSGNYGYLGDSSYGVYGKNNGSGNYGYLGGSNYGVSGNSYTGYGVYGSSSSGYGVFGLSNSGYGVYGYGGNYGVYGFSNNYGVYGENNNTGNKGYLGVAGGGVEGRSDSGFGVYGWSGSGYGIYGYSSSSYAGYFAGDVFVTGDVSALSFTDRTPYPKDLATAYQAVMSMERLGDGQYEENNKEKQLDHSKLSNFIKSKDGNRDLSATVSAHNEVLKDLIRKVEAQQQLIETQNAQIRQMTETLQTNKQQPQIGITKGAVQ